MSEVIAKTKQTPTRRVPKYVAIAESIKADIAGGMLQPDDRLPSFGSMRKQFQVTIDTIDKAHSLLEQEGLVRREPGRGVFVERKTRIRTGNIGLILNKTDENCSYNRAFLNGILDQARQQGLNIMLVDINDPDLVDKTDGVLFYCRSIDVEKIQFPITMPRVLILEPATNISIANVVADDFNGAKMATEHLLKLGHRRISTILSYAVDPYAIQRFAGYRAALEGFGIPFDERLVRYVELSRENYVMDTEATMGGWIAQGWRSLNSTAVLAPSDEGIFGIMTALGEVGLSVPQDVSIVGFDGLLRPQQAALQLTTIEVPLREIGTLSVDLIVEQIQRGSHEAKQIIAPVQLRVGTTTARIANIQ
jgi:GntR family transcriptional regulator of arabinose operon